MGKLLHIIHDSEPCNGHGQQRSRGIGGPKTRARAQVETTAQTRGNMTFINLQHLFID